MRILFAIALAAAAASAQEAEEWKRQLEAERAAREADRREFERRLEALEARKNEGLRTEVEAYLEEHDPFEEEHGGHHHSGVDIAAFLDVTVGGSTATDEALAQINLGDHDPRVRGINVRNEELVVSADIGSHFHALLGVVYKIDDGESDFELEEAFVLATALPAGLEVKAGQYFVEFGAVNALHPHAWEFLNQPVILGRVFGGDGWRGQGVRLSWIAPTALPFMVLVGAQNARGETQASFLGEEGETVGDYVLADRPFESLSDLAWNARAEVSRDFAALSARLGLSFGYGPNGTGPDASTAIYGIDLRLDWRGDCADAGRPCVTWQTEVVWRDYEAAAQTDPLVLPATTYEDWGLYTQVVWSFHDRWTSGVRYDFASSDGAYPGAAHRLSVALTYHASERARIRLQANWDDVEGLDALVPGAGDHAFSLWINVNVALGRHGAHGS